MSPLAVSLLFRLAGDDGYVIAGDKARARVFHVIVGVARMTGWGCRVSRIRKQSFSATDIFSGVLRQTAPPANSTELVEAGFGTSD
jgi:hypothetical protein